MGYLTVVTNRATGKRYRISTVELGRSGVWQTAVFRKRFGLFGLRRPAFFVGGADEQQAPVQHARIEAMVRDVRPAKWEAGKWALVSEIMRDD